MSIPNPKSLPVDLNQRITDIETALTTPLISAAAAPTVHPSPAGGATTYVYSIEPLFGVMSAPAGATASISTGPSALSASAFNTITWAPVPNATGYNVRRSTGGATQGLIAKNVQTTSFVDMGSPGDGSTAPSLNATGVVGGIVQQPVAAYSLDGAVKRFGLGVITKAGVAALTLGLPIAGPQASGGQDGLTIQLVDTTGHAHTVTTTANKINGADDKATFDGTVGTTLTLFAYNGAWYAAAQSGISFSEV